MMTKAKVRGAKKKVKMKDLPSAKAAGRVRAGGVVINHEEQYAPKKP